MVKTFHRHFPNAFWIFWVRNILGRERVEFSFQTIQETRPSVKYPVPVADGKMWNGGPKWRGKSIREETERNSKPPQLICVPWIRICCGLQKSIRTAVLSGARSDIALSFACLLLGKKSPDQHNRGEIWGEYCWFMKTFLMKTLWRPYEDLFPVSDNCLSQHFFLKQSEISTKCSAVISLWKSSWNSLSLFLFFHFRERFCSVLTSTAVKWHWHLHFLIFS